MSFRARMLVFFVIIVVVPMIAVAYVLAILTSESAAGRADSQLAQALRVGIEVYEEQRDETVDDLEQVGRDQALRARFEEGDEDGLRDAAARLARDDPSIESVVLYDADRELIASVGDRSAVAYATATPTAPGGRRIGVIAVSTTTAGELAGEVARLTGLEARVVRGGGRIATTLEEPAAAADTGGDVDTTLEVAGGDEFRGRYTTVQDPVGSPAQLGVFQDATELSRSIRGDQVLVGAILLGFFLLAVVSSILVVRSLGRQIDRFLRAARAVGRGDFEARVPAQGGDEFAALGREFNAMSRQLKENVEELERRRREREGAIRRIGDAFAAGLDPGGTATLAAQSAVEACQADAGHAVHGELEAANRQTVGREDERLERALRAAESAARTAPDEPSIAVEGGAHALAAALRGGPKLDGRRPTLGYLAIARLDRPFDDAELGMFVYLSAQASVSLDNAGLHATVRDQAVTDSLTGLSNRRHFDAALEAEIGRSRRFGGDVGLLMLDLDGFKPINDRYGHQEGDRVLIEVAGLLRRLTREVDHLARYGGDEIAIILPQTELAGAELLGERVRAGIEAMAVEPSEAFEPVPLTASVGAAALPECAGDRQTLVRAADTALYAAKRAGGNRVRGAGSVPLSR